MKTLKILRFAAGMLAAGGLPQIVAQAGTDVALAAINNSAPALAVDAGDLPPASFTLARTNQLLTLNFRSAPLREVLSYFSEAAGFIVLPEVEINGRVDVWSNKPVTKAEAVGLLDSVLRRNGYAAIRDGQTLSIVPLEEAKRRAIPTESGGNPDLVARDERIVTHILPVSSVNAAQAAKELAPLLSSSAELSADDAGNALVMTDSRVNIRRMAEIVKALDAASSSVNMVRVFSLKHADPKGLAAAIKDLFPSQDSRTGSAGGRDTTRFGGGPGPATGGGLDQGGGSNAEARSPRIQIVPEDRSNSLVVSAPDAVMKVVAGIIGEMDRTVEDVTEVRLFRLRNADASEMSELLGSLFPDVDNSNTAGGAGPQNQEGPPFGPPADPAAAQGGSQKSPRSLKMGRVTSVVDHRTGSLVVSAAASLMPRIAAIVERLDANPARKQKAYVISLKNTEPEDVLQVMNDLFPSSSKSGRLGSGSQSGSILTQRSQTLLQQQLQNSTSGGFGGTTGGAGGGKGTP